jgi:hypothetical protein
MADSRFQPAASFHQRHPRLRDGVYSIEAATPATPPEGRSHQMPLLLGAPIQ